MIAGDVVVEDGVDVRVGRGVVAAPVVEGEGEGASDVCDQVGPTDQHVASPVGGESGQLLRHELDGLRADVETWYQQVWRTGRVGGCVSGCMWVGPWVCQWM